MNEPPDKARQVELLISTLLRVGVAASLAVVVAGTILSFVHHPDYASSGQPLERLVGPSAAFPHTFHDLFAGLKTFRGQSVIVVGLLLLIATPVVRVAVSIFAFVYEKDYVFVAITATVLALLILSFLLGAAG